MNKTELIARVAKISGLTKKDSEKAVNATIQAMFEELERGGTVQLVGFGTFKVRYYKQREGRNPRTNEPIVISAGYHAAFKSGKTLRDAVNKPGTIASF